MRIEREDLLILRLSRRKFFSPLMQQTGGKMRLRIFGRQFRCFAISLQGIVGVIIFDQAGDGEPCAGLPLRLLTCGFRVGFERSGGSQKRLRLGIVGARQHQP